MPQAVFLAIAITHAKVRCAHGLGYAPYSDSGNTAN